jgi:hypothetical protein
MRKISYNGSLHTKKVFLMLMRERFPEVIYWRMKGDRFVTPGKIKKTDIDGWMSFTAATWV